ncbi:unnamed protein product [Symbiodinium sp. CCMP2592]|nr:unnamed protein product [Symbiodinium sp. CCMP2592]
MAPWWFWSHVVGTVLGAGLHDRVREWSAKASREVQYITQMQPDLLSGGQPWCDLGGYHVATYLRLIEDWLQQYLEAPDVVDPILRPFLLASKTATHALPQCPQLMLPARLISTEWQLHQLKGSKDSLLSGLILHSADVVEMLFLHIKIQDKLPALFQHHSTAVLSHRAWQRTLAVLKTWFSYKVRPYIFASDNNCAGQWCFFEPCEEFCPTELCFDARIDWVENSFEHYLAVLQRLLTDRPGVPWPTYAHFGTEIRVIDGKEVVPIYVSHSKASVDGGVRLGLKWFVFGWTVHGMGV